MSVPTVSWSETTPAGTEDASLGDNRVRELKTQIREVINVDHDFPSSGQASDVGQHKQVTLQEQADLGTGAVNATILGSQTVDTKGELIYTDEDDNDVQLTIKGTPVAVNALTAKTTAVSADLVLLCDSADSYKSKKLTLANLMNFVYPIGSVITLGVSTNPATLLGVGTWTAIEGKVIVGKAGSGTFNTLDATGGAETVTLDATMIPAHTHTVVATNCDGGGTAGGAGGSGESLNTITSSSVGGGLAHNNLPPYIVKYVWQRVS